MMDTEHNNSLREDDLNKFVAALKKAPAIYLTETEEIFGTTFNICEIIDVARDYCCFSLKELIHSADAIETLKTLFN